jgi:hypothetical protein
MKNSTDTIRNRTRDLPTCSAVPQLTAPPRAPTEANNIAILTEHCQSLLDWKIIDARGKQALDFLSNFNRFHSQAYL